MRATRLLGRLEPEDVGPIGLENFDFSWCEILDFCTMELLLLAISKKAIKVQN